MEKKTATTVATFGAVLGAMGVAPELQADIISLSFNPGVNSGGLVGQHIVELSVSFTQWNDGVGQTLYAGGLSSIAVAQLSQNISAGTFGGTSAILLPPYGSGTMYIGFRYAGNVGWFSMDLGGG